MNKFILVFGKIISILLAGSLIFGLIGQLGDIFVGEYNFHYFSIIFLIFLYITIKNIVKTSFITLLLEGLYVTYMGLTFIGGYQYHHETFNYIFGLADDDIDQKIMLQFFEALADVDKLSFIDILKENYIYATQNIIIFLLIFSSITILYWLRYYFMKLNNNK